MNIQANVACLLASFLVLHLVNKSNAIVDPCIYDSDPKGIINITSLGSVDGTPMWKNIQPNTSDDHAYSYNPCYPFSQSNCKDVAGCQTYATNETLAYPLGSQSSVQWLPAAGDSPPALTYISDERKLYVNLRCLNLGEPDQLEAYGYDNVVKMYVLTLSSKCACWNGCIDGPGSSTTADPSSSTSASSSSSTSVSSSSSTSASSSSITTADPSSNSTTSPASSVTIGHGPGYFCVSIFIFLHFFRF